MKAEDYKLEIKSPTVLDYGSIPEGGSRYYVNDTRVSASAFLVIQRQIKALGEMEQVVDEMIEHYKEGE